MSVTIDGRPLSALGVTGRVLDGWLDGPAFTREVLSVPGLLGVIPQDDVMPTTRQCASS